MIQLNKTSISIMLVAFMVLVTACPVFAIDGAHNIGATGIDGVHRSPGVAGVKGFEGKADTHNTTGITKTTGIDGVTRTNGKSEGAYIHGYPDDTFHPDAILTRAEFAKILDNLYGLEGLKTRNNTTRNTAAATVKGAVNNVTRNIKGAVDNVTRNVTGNTTKGTVNNNVTRNTMGVTNNVTGNTTGVTNNVTRNTTRNTTNNFTNDNISKNDAVGMNRNITANKGLVNRNTAVGMNRNNAAGMTRNNVTRNTAERNLNSRNASRYSTEINRSTSNDAHPETAYIPMRSARGEYPYEFNMMNRNSIGAATPPAGYRGKNRTVDNNVNNNVNNNVDNNVNNNNVTRAAGGNINTGNLPNMQGMTGVTGTHGTAGTHGVTDTRGLTGTQDLTGTHGITGTQNRAARGFTDVPADHWAARHIDNLDKYIPDHIKSFNPNEPLLREEFNAILSKIKGYEITDAKPGDATITRAEAISFLNTIEGRAKTWKGGKTFLDVPATHWAHADIMNAANGE